MERVCTCLWALPVAQDKLPSVRWGRAGQGRVDVNTNRRYSGDSSMRRQA